MPAVILSNPLGADDAQRIGLDIREYAVGEIVDINDFAATTLIRTGYALAIADATDVLIAGTGTPNSSIGLDGQWYLDTTNEVLWGPKTSGLWPSDPIRPDRGVAHFAVDGAGHLQMTYSTGTTVDLGYIIGAAPHLTAGPVTTGAAGSAAAAAIVDLAPGEQRLDLTLPQGVQGVQGIQGVKGDTGRGFTPRGAWVTGTAYAVDDLVRYTDGSTYRVTTAHTSSGTLLPTNGSYYTLFAQAAVLADATGAAKGAVQLAGDLGGTAAAPTVVSGASHTHTSAQVSDATAAATANMVARRDAAGRLAVAAPGATGDAATKGYIDSTAGDTAATANTLARRDAAGALTVATPTATGHAATKGYVDTATAAKARAQLRQATAQTGLTANAWTTLTFDAEDFDTHNAHNNVASNSRFTCPAGQDGLYAVEGKLQLGGNAFCNVRVIKNGATLPNGTGVSTADPSLQSVVTGIKLVQLAAGDYLEIQGFNTTASWGTAVFPDGTSGMVVFRLD